MGGSSQELAELEPFEIIERGTDSGGGYHRFEATVHPAPDAGAPEVELDHERWLIDNPDEHVHPQQKEIVEVLAGEYAVEIDGTEHRLSEGDEITLPRNTPHRHWNPSAEPARVAHEQHPARDSAAFGEALYVLAQNGETDEKGIPDLLQFAVINEAYPGNAYTTEVPIPIQKAMGAVLGPVGRMAGYEADLSRDD